MTFCTSLSKGFLAGESGGAARKYCAGQLTVCFSSRAARSGPLAKKSEQTAGQDAAHHNPGGSEDAAVNAGCTHEGYGRGFSEVSLTCSRARESKLYWRL